jgi:hypothetical protein
VPGKSVKVFANASAATPPAVYFAKTFTDFPAPWVIWRLYYGFVVKIHVSPIFRPHGLFGVYIMDLL